jgi:predicted  nucleic acid-binding Zn-ribbon protein
MAGVATLFREIHRLRVLIRDAQEQLDRIPRQRKAYQTKVARAEQTLRDEQETIKKLKVTISDKDKQLKEKEDQIHRYQIQRDGAASKKEYDALVFEIAHAKQVCSQLEEEILLAMTETDERVAKIPGLEKTLADARAELARFESEVPARQTVLQSEVQRATAELKAQEAQIPRDLKPQYDRTIHSLGADGFAAVRDRICSACYIEVIYQIEVNLKNDQFAVCSNCGRILYLPETPPARVEEED